MFFGDYWHLTELFKFHIINIEVSYAREKSENLTY